MDLATCKPEAILATCNAEPGSITGVIGGPPCQGFSVIGQRRKHDPRNRLVGHFFRHVAAIRPAFFIMENVPGILEDGYRQTLRRGIDKVTNRYTIVGPTEFDAWDLGAATRRVRAIVVGFDSKRVNTFTTNDLQSLKISPSNRRTVYHAIHDLPKPGADLWATYERKPDDGDKGAYARDARVLPPHGLGQSEAIQQLKAGRVSGITETRHTFETVKRFAATAQGAREAISRCPRLSWDEPCKTLRAGTGKDKGSYQSIRPIHPEQPRVITVREAARLQGFPDWFRFHDTKWHSFRMIGNSVSPKLSEALLRFMASLLKETRPAQ